MHDQKKPADSYYLREISSGNAVAFEHLFFEYYYPLCGFALKFTGQSETARDVVQDVFFKIWKNREELEIRTSLKSYLYQAVRHQALNKVEQQRSIDRVREKWKEEAILYGDRTNGSAEAGYAENRISETLVQRIWELVKIMPPQRRMIFELHRKHGLSYQEIADVMGLKRKTVENHLARALEDLRSALDVDKFID